MNKQIENQNKIIDSQNVQLKSLKKDLMEELKNTKNSNSNTRLDFCTNCARHASIRQRNKRTQYNLDDLDQKEEILEHSNVENTTMISYDPIREKESCLNSTIKRIRRGQGKRCAKKELKLNYLMSKRLAQLEIGQVFSLPKKID